MMLERQNPHAKNEVDFLTPHRKINSKQIKGLTVRGRSTKYLKENRKEKFQDTERGKDFLNVAKDSNRHYSPRRYPNGQ